MGTPTFELEDAVIDAWPAAECEELDGWCLRATSGPSRQANSAATLSAGKALTLMDRLERVEAFYGARGQAATFYVGPSSTPSGLDEALQERGYAKEGESLAATSRPLDVVSRLARTLETSIGTSLTETWWQHSSLSSPDAGAAETFRGTVERLGTRCRFVTTRGSRGNVTGTCLGITSEQRLGVYNLHTCEGSNLGTATALLRALAECALAERMSELYLLIELDDTAARPLYEQAGLEQAGFTEAFRYHYRVLSGSAAPSR